MGPFAAGNEFVTIILALIPLAVFLLSNLFKASQKPANPPAKAPKPNNNGGVPGTVDLDSFLREAKKRKAQAQGSTPPPPPVAPRPIVQSQNPKPQNRPAKPAPLPQPRPVRQEKKREVPTQNPRPRQEPKSPAPQVPAFVTPQLQAGLVVDEPADRGRPKPVARPRMMLATQSPVTAAVELVRSGKAAPTSFVLQEIFGRPRCVRPFQLPATTTGGPAIPS